MDVSSEADHEIHHTPSFLKTLYRHKLIIIFLGTLYLASVYLVRNNPRGWAISQLKTGFILFGPSFSSLILILYIGIYLIYRYYLQPFTRDEHFYQLFWGLSFLIYSILFIGLCLQALGLSIADMSNPKIFFLWRLPMIAWVSGMWIGTSFLYSNNKRAIYASGISIFVLGLAWFIYGFLIKENIEKTMYGFLFWMFIPMCFLLSYMWWTYSKEENITSARILALGFLFMGLTYAMWAPYHFPDLIYMYFIFYQIFIVAQAFIFAGFYALPKEIAAKSAV